MSQFLPWMTGVVGVITGGTGMWLAIRKDTREARNQAIVEASKTIELLKEQNQILRDQVATMEAREAQWIDREKRLEDRITELEREYRTLVKTIASLGIDPSKLHS